MKPNDFATALMELSRLSGSKDVCLIASVFQRSPEKTTAATLKKLSSMEGVGSHELDMVLSGAVAFSRSVGGAKFAGLLEALATILRSRGALSVDVFVADAIAHLNAPKPAARSKKKSPVVVRDNIVRSFLKRLDECLGDEGFAEPYGELERDKTISADEVVAIARAFTTKKPNSRPKALEAIWARQHALLVSRSKSASRAGRSAA